MGFKHLILSATPLFSAAAGQSGVWKDGQVNSSICSWSLARAALIRDTIYIDGGNLYWTPGMEDGSYGAPQTDSWIDRKVWSFNLTNPIDSDTNVTSLLSKNTLEKYNNGLGANYHDGAMLANDDQFLLYGGNFEPTIYDPPDSDEVLGYEIYRSEVDKLWRQDFIEGTLTDKTNRWVAYGGAASAPSENRAWYFSGMTSATHGPIDLLWREPDSYTTAQDISNFLIEVDMSEQGSGVWTNSSLPRNVTGRANPELVWVPIGEQGILVVLGGVVYPYWTEESRQSEDPEASEEESPVFMEEIDIYDIAAGEWYQQNTTGGPGTRTRGCAVLASARDYSSFNIYYYGGFNGISPTDAYSDDVWVLSLPSFTWTQLNDGTESHARAGHKCFRPYGDQMIVFGGSRSLPGRSLSCLNPGPFAFFNMTSGDWVETYHPEEAGEYGVPDKVVDVIGGDAAGTATLTTPTPSGWATEKLEELFSQTYDMDKLPKWGPFTAAESSTERPESPEDDGDDEDGGGGGLPSWVAPVLGVVLGLMVITGALVVFFVWRKRKIFRNNPNATTSDTSTEDTYKRIGQWIRGQTAQPPAAEKAPTVTTTDETAVSPEMRSVSALQRDDQASPPLSTPGLHETAGNPIVELADTSLAELSDAQSDQYVQRYSRFSEQGRSVSPPLAAAAWENNSTVSGSSAAAAAEQVDSPTAGRHNPYRLSNPSHIPSLSEALASPLAQTMAEAPGHELGDANRPSLAARSQSDHLSNPPVSPPTSPPTSGDVPADDYITARSGAGSPGLRKSVFRESEEDMEKK